MVLLSPTVNHFKTEFLKRWIQANPFFVFLKREKSDNVEVALIRVVSEACARLRSRLGRILC
jgi:hypothetical protein